jgi:hypothetical protein
MSLLHEDSVTVLEPFLWLRLITQSFGFAFIAFAYYFSSRGERATKSYLCLVSFVSAFSVLFISGVLIVASPFLELPPVNVVDECFTIGNLVFLGYVIYHLVKRLELHHESISGLWAPTAFSLFFLTQYSLLISEIDGSETAFVFAHVVRLASLILFIRIYYSSGRSQR